MRRSSPDTTAYKRNGVRNKGVFLSLVPCHTLITRPKSTHIVPVPCPYLPLGHNPPHPLPAGVFGEEGLAPGRAEDSSHNNVPCSHARATHACSSPIFPSRVSPLPRPGVDWRGVRILKEEYGGGDGSQATTHTTNLPLTALHYSLFHFSPVNSLFSWLCDLHLGIACLKRRLLTKKW